MFDDYVHAMSRLGRPVLPALAIAGLFLGVSAGASGAGPTDQGAVATTSPPSLAAPAPTSSIPAPTTTPATSVVPTTTAPPALTPFVAPTAAPQPPVLTWGPCEAGVDDDFDCATLTVPLDYDNQTGPSIGIALIRLPAEGRRDGLILLNPGGPGGSGYDFAENAAHAIDYTFELDRRFDIIGFDPRGVDRSNGVRCLDDEAMDDTMYLDGTPDTPEEEAALEAADDAWAAACVANHGDTLQYFSTANTARDMEWIRWATGDAQTTFIGISYGTYLGAVWATMFPDAVRAMVLDAAYSPTSDTEFEQYATQLVGFEASFNEWAAWCEETSTCAFTATDVGARWDALLATLDATPLKSSDGREVNSEVMETATVAAMYDDLAWPVLASALANAETGNGDRLLALADEYNERDSDGQYSTISDSNYVISCASGLVNDIPADPTSLLAAIKAAAPRFSQDLTVEDLTEGSGCEDLMPGPGEAVVPSYQGAGPVLVIGGLHDPATPFEWSLELTAALGPNAVLMSYSGEGHGALLAASCVDDAYGALIRDLTLPPAGTACQPDPLVERPAFWDNVPVPAGATAASDPEGLISALGFDPTSAYAGFWTFTDDIGTIEQAYRDGFSALGFQLAPTYTDEGFPVIPMLAPDGRFVDVMLFSPMSLATRDDLGDAVDLVPAGQGLAVVVAWNEYY